MKYLLLYLKTFLPVFPIIIILGCSNFYSNGKSSKSEILRNISDSTITKLVFWQKDSLGCLKLRSLDLALELSRDLNLMKRGKRRNN